MLCTTHKRDEWGVVMRSALDKLPTWVGAFIVLALLGALLLVNAIRTVQEAIWVNGALLIVMIFLTVAAVWVAVQFAKRLER